MAEDVEFAVRSALSDDIGAFVQMRGELQHHMKARNPNLWDLAEGWRAEKEELHRSCMDDPECHLVAGIARDDSIVGMGLGRIIRNPALKPAEFGSIDDVWVVPQFRRWGVGTKIVEDLVRYFRQWDIEALTLNYVEANIEAVSFWARLGFQPAIVRASARRADVEKRLALP